MADHQSVWSIGGICGVFSSMCVCGTCDTKSVWKCSYEVFVWNFFSTIHMASVYFHTIKEQSCSILGRGAAAKYNWRSGVDVAVFSLVLGMCISGCDCRDLSDRKTVRKMDTKWEKTIFKETRKMMVSVSVIGTLNLISGFCIRKIRKY